MTLDRQILLNVLALDKAIKEYEFVHVYMGPLELSEEAGKIPPESAREQLLLSLDLLDGPAGSSFSPSRKIYIRDLVMSVLTQADHFIFDKPMKSVQEVVERLMGTRICPPFDIDHELQDLAGFVNAEGYASIPQYRSQKNIICFNSPAGFSDFLKQTIESLSAMTARKYGSIFHHDLCGIFDRSSISIEFTSGEPPCYYRYNGNYQGVVGISYRESFTDADIKNFLAHEVLPGHHFYYLLRQWSLDHEKTDLLHALDLFYSPETVINEGIAMNSDLIFRDKLEPEIAISLKIEKFLHKLFYNCWHQVNIEFEPIDPYYLMILRNEFDFPFETIESRIKYFTSDARYYTPCYPLGSFYIENFILNNDELELPILYQQHSVSTLSTFQTPAK